MNKQKRKHTPEFNARIAFEAIQGINTQTDIAKEYENLQRKIGQLTMDVDFLEKKVRLKKQL